jgi:hypothetical protein
MHATQATAHKGLNNLSPGALVLYSVDRGYYGNNGPTQSDGKCTFMKADQRRLTYDYKVGEQVLIKAYNPDKLEARWLGPYAKEQVHVNGTLTICKMPMVMDIISIRWLKPYRS